MYVMMQKTVKMQNLAWMFAIPEIDE